MRELLTFVLIGLTAGSVYGLAAVGLVLTYTTSGIFNFAHGAVGAAAVFVFYWLHVEHAWPWPLTAAVVIIGFAGLMGVVLERIARALEGTEPAVKVAATVGLLLLIVGIGNVWYGDVTTPFPRFLPTGTVDVGSIFIGYDQLIVVAISIIATLGLYVFTRRARLGIAMRGVVDDPVLLAMTGERPVRVRQRAWIIGAMFASTSGVLLAPNLSLSGLVLTEIVIQAFAAAAIGFFRSLPWTYVGGLIVGVAAAVASNYTQNIKGLSAFATGLPFAILFVVLIVTPRAKLVTRTTPPTKFIPASWQAPAKVRVIGGAIFVAFMCFIPSLVGFRLNTWSNGLVFVIFFLSLGLLVRTSGQVSLCHIAFMAVGASSMSHLTEGAGIPWLFALVLAGLVSVPVGAIVAIPATRLSGVYLALATFGFGVFLDHVMYTTKFMFTDSPLGIQVPRPSWTIFGLDLSTDQGYYYVLLLFAVIAVLSMLALQQSRLGRLLRALADSPTALETNGARPNVTRVLVFCISAFVASISGALFGSLYQFTSGAQFSYLLSLQLLALLIIVVAGEPWFAVICATGFVILPSYLDFEGVFDYMTILFGLFALTFAMTMEKAPHAPGYVTKFFDRFGRRADDAEPGQARVGGGPAVEQVPPTSRRDAPAGGLEVKDLTVRFGGVHAVNGLSMTAPAGVITGLIGPNGAGKTTTFSACSGLLRPSSGSVHLHGEDVSKFGPSIRARRGLGRTFQRVELFGRLTVRENVEMGFEAALAGGNPATQLMARPKDRREMADAVYRALDLVGIAHLSQRRAGHLSVGQRRLVELARVVAGGFDMLLLDEPSSGLSPDESDSFGDVLRAIVSDGKTGILLVEHDMALVRKLCDWVYVLDFGQLIFEGTAQEMASSEVVKAAYLGSEAGEGGTELMELVDDDDIALSTERVNR